MYVFSYIMLAIITLCTFDLQALYDLLVFYNEYLEYEMKRYITPLLFYWMVYIYIFNTCHFQTKPQFLYMKCFVIELIGYESDGDDMKATGDMATFVH